jgi:hypothetical protein
MMYSWKMFRPLDQFSAGSERSGQEKGHPLKIRKLWHKLSVKNPSMGWKNGKASADRI